MDRDAKRARVTVIDTVNQTKRCNRCNKIKPWSEFNRRKASKVCGVQGHCKVCDLQWGKDYHKVRKYPVRRIPQKERARAETKKLETAGVLVRPDECKQCGREGTVHAHHLDYDHPEKVVYLCRWCHEEEHWQERYGPVQGEA